MESFIAFLEEVPDPRAANARHELSEILFVAVVATLCDATSCAEIAQFCRSKLDFLRRLVPLEHGAPSHDTFSRVLRLLDPKAFAAAFAGFMAAYGAAARAEAPPGTLALDGKSLRRGYDKGRAHMPPLVVTVFAYDTRLVLAQAAAHEGGEARAALEALGLVRLQGATVTADAIHCTRAMTEAVRKGGADYVIALKANQGRLVRDAAAAIEAADPATPRATSMDDGHGRRVERTAVVIPFRQGNGPNALKDLAAIASIERVRSVGGAASTTTHLYVLSRIMSPDEVLRIVQDHWSIENNQHWSLDVLFREDEARTRKDHAPANLAVLRRLALNILRGGNDKLSLNLRRRKATWEEPYLLSLLAQMR